MVSSHQLHLFDHFRLPERPVSSPKLANWLLPNFQVVLLHSVHLLSPADSSWSQSGPEEPAAPAPVASLRSQVLSPAASTLQFPCLERVSLEMSAVFCSKLCSPLVANLTSISAVVAYLPSCSN